MLDFLQWRTDVSALQIILLIIIIPFTILNIRYLLVGRHEKKAQEERKARTYRVLKENIGKMGKADDIKIGHFVSDAGANFLVAINEKTGAKGVACEDDFFSFPDEKALSSSVIVSEKSSEKIERVVVRVSYGNEIYDFPIGTKMHRKKFLGKFVLEVAEDFSKALSSKKA